MLSAAIASVSAAIRAWAMSISVPRSALADSIAVKVAAAWSAA